MFGGGPKVKISKELHERIQKYAAMAGYSSVDEFVIHALEKELQQLEEAQSDDEIKEKLKGLGYLA
jgi:metal-responsive CopG/Arc/MetJ family transcriptional regulator